MAALQRTAPFAFARSPDHRRDRPDVALSGDKLLSRPSRSSPFEQNVVTQQVIPT